MTLKGCGIACGVLLLYDLILQIATTVVRDGLAMTRNECGIAMTLNYCGFAMTQNQVSQ